LKSKKTIKAQIFALCPFPFLIKYDILMDSWLAKILEGMGASLPNKS